MTKNILKATRNFSKYKNVHIPSKCVSSNVYPCKTRIAIKKFGYNGGANTTIKENSSDECGKENNNTVKGIVLLNIDAPAFIPGEKLCSFINIYAPVYTEENIKGILGKYTNNAGSVLDISCSSKQEINSTVISVNELHNGLLSDSLLVNNAIISIDGPNPLGEGWVGGHSCQSLRQFEYQVDNHQMSDGINYNTVCTYVSGRVNEQKSCILHSYLYISNDTKDRLIRECGSSSTYSADNSIMHTGGKTNIHVDSDNTNNISSLTIESSINTFSFENIKENILCNQWDHNNDSTKWLKVMGSPLVHIASPLYITIQDFSQDPLLGTFNSCILDKVIANVRNTVTANNTNYDTCRRETGADVNQKYNRQFGFLPLKNYVFPVYSSSKKLNTSDMQNWVRSVHNVVRKSGVFNYKEARITVPSGLNILNWRRYLSTYDIPILLEYLQFGFPLNIDYNLFTFNETTTNHASANMYPLGVDKYFKDELEYGAIVGPLKDKLHCSPLMARKKPDGGVRVIVDLSWPLDGGVNSCVPSNYFDFIQFQLKYPSIDNVVEKIKQFGPTYKLFKIDLQRAFRNLRIDPFDYNVLGLSWRSQTYVDVALPFGFKQGASSCQMCTDAITYLMWTQKHWVMAYLDDFVAVCPPSTANNAYLTLKNLLEDLGPPINFKKVEEPSSTITCLGIEINAKEGTLAIPDQKLNDIKHLCVQWLNRRHASRNQLQKLLGHLLYIHKSFLRLDYLQIES